MPGSFSLRHAYLATDTEPRMMRNPIDLYVVAGSTPSQRRESDCSGRSLATLLVAWVSAAMVASVLLRWKYMWIALAVLTLLFLIACGYAACTSRRALQSQMLTDEEYMDQRRMDIQSVSGNVNCSDRSEPPAYQTYWITDLPPPYAVVSGAESPPQSEERVQPPGPQPSSPPPYSVAIQDHATPPLDQSQPSAISHVTGDATTAIAINNDKDTSQQSRHVLTGGQYFSNFITRFGLSRSRNVEQNSRDENNLRNQGNQEISGSSSRPDNTF